MTSMIKTLKSFMDQYCQQSYGIVLIIWIDFWSHYHSLKEETQRDCQYWHWKPQLLHIDFKAVTQQLQCIYFTHSSLNEIANDIYRGMLTFSNEFFRWHFQKHFLEWKLLYGRVSIVSGNVSAPNKQQAIAWTNDDKYTGAYIRRKV